MVPVARQAVALLREVHPLAGCHHHAFRAGAIRTVTSRCVAARGARSVVPRDGAHDSGRVLGFRPDFIEAPAGPMPSGIATEAPTTGSCSCPSGA